MKVTIDLLPAEFKLEKLKRAKFYKVQIIGVAAILVVTFLASLVIALRILQSQNTVNLQKSLTQSEQKISDLKNTQAALLLLKNRLTSIDQYLGVSSKGVQMYKLINELMPASASIGSISVDKNGEVLVLVTVSDSDSLDNLITSLVSDEGNQGKISQVSLESINRGRDGIYRLNLKIKPS